MVTLYELAGRSHIFRLSDGSFLRLKARGSATIDDDSKVSQEIHEAEKRKSIRVKQSPKKVSDSIQKKPTTKKEV